VPGSSFALVRYNSDGSLDATFGIGGKVATDFGGSDVAFALVQQPDGKLLAAGDSFFLAIRNTDFVLARYNANGSLDPTFGIGGKVITDFGGADEAGSIVLQADGKVVAVGFGNTPTSNSGFALARYNIVYLN